MKKQILFSIFFSALLLALSTASAQQTQSKSTDAEMYNVHSSHRKYHTMNGAFDSGNVSKIITSKNGQTYRMIYADNKLTEFYVNEKLIDPKNYAEYQKIIDEIMLDVKRDREMAEIDGKEAKLEAEQARLEKKQAIFEEQQEKKERDEERVREKKEALRDEMMADAERKQEKEDEMQARLDARQTIQDKKQEMEDREMAKKDKETVRNIITDLLEFKLVKDRDALKSFSLTENEFLVNGKLQSAELLEKFRTKYIHQKGFGIYYGNVTRSGSGIFYEKDELK